jgi:hypothetical protein
VGLSMYPHRKHSNVWLFRSSRRPATTIMFMLHIGQGGRSAIMRSAREGISHSLDKAGALPVSRSPMNCHVRSAMGRRLTMPSESATQKGRSTRGPTEPAYSLALACSTRSV